ncbi:hypothetical protein GLOIN_2v1790207 [Rhizophagus irregularis DAOM 181602=DAOM 197198]|nr:hypothetical protein GLOIN_2v1790207 [Rhizophagus irregularis DAOM 181602=DAOM 197198]CAB4399140.1 unnamed protein product [Rhizophagus irregularis]CAG8586269.1 22817_t:CDS:2 [Rhizophagus irregularis]
MANHFLDKAKELLDSNTFAELKKKEAIKECEKNQKIIIKECEIENTFTTDTSLPIKPIKFSETLKSKENTFTFVTL